MTTIKALNVIALTMILAALSSCSKSPSGGGKGADNNVRQPETNPIELSGIYHAKLTAVNPQVTGPLQGKVNISRVDANLTVYVSLNEPTPNLIHEQKLFAGSACPGPEQDLNMDGYIDAFETRTFLGRALVPLDKDLSSVEAGYNFFPSNYPTGGYWYEQIVPYEAFLNDLMAIDENLNDDYAKLPAEKTFELEELVVMVLGVEKEKGLPFTVRSIGGYANFQTLPIACGVVKKVKSTPGRINTDAPVSVPTGAPGGVSGDNDGIDPSVTVPEGSVVLEEGEEPKPEGPTEPPTEEPTSDPDNYGDEDEII